LKYPNANQHQWDFSPEIYLVFHYLSHKQFILLFCNKTEAIGPHLFSFDRCNTKRTTYFFDGWKTNQEPVFSLMDGTQQQLVSSVIDGKLK
jgi:hypothetical protein